MIDTRTLGERVAALMPLADTELGELAAAAHAAGGVDLAGAELNACLVLMRGDTPTLRWLASHSDEELRAHVLHSRGREPTQLQRIVATYFGLQSLIEDGWPVRG